LGYVFIFRVRNYRRIVAYSSKINFHNVGLIAEPYIPDALNDARKAPTSNVPVSAMILFLSLIN
jgi:hypothetical protein